MEKISLDRPPGPSEGRSIRVLFSGPFSALDSVEGAGAFLEECVIRLGMRALTPAIVLDVPLEISKQGGEVWEDEGGITALIALSTSHCSYHSWPSDNRAVLDIYSCRDYDPEIVVELCRKYFEATHIHVHDTTYTLDTAGSTYYP